MKRLLDAHVESSGRYYSADARSADAESKTISVDVVVVVVVVVVSTTPERSLNAKPYPNTRPTPRH
jgi:hypothetical protein